jgi:hypothetical protein
LFPKPDVVSQGAQGKIVNTARIFRKIGAVETVAYQLGGVVHGFKYTPPGLEFPI